MNDIITEQSGAILRIQLNRPTKKNAMTSAMYVALADILNGAAKDDSVRVVLWYGAGGSFTAGNDMEDFLKSPPRTGDSPQARLMAALLDFDKPIVVAVQGVAIGGGTTMLTHCDFVYAAENTRFQLPFINLALVPEFGSSTSLPARLGHIHAAELFMLGQPFTAAKAESLGLVTRVVPDPLAAATETAEQLANKPAGALQATKRLLRTPLRAGLQEAIRLENQEFTARLASADTKEAITAFLEKRPPNFTRTRQPAAVA